MIVRLGQSEEERYAVEAGQMTPEQTTAYIQAQKAGLPTPVYVTPQQRVQAPVTQPALTSWLEQQMISGVKNKYLLAGAGGIFLLTALRTKRR